MTTTTQTLEALNWSNYNNLGNNISAFLLQYLSGRGIYSLEQFNQNPIIDFSSYRLLGDTDLKGIHLLYKAETLKLTNRFNATYEEKFTDRSLNLTPFKNLKNLVQDPAGSTQVFDGDISSLTSLVKISMVSTIHSFVSTPPNNLLMPTLSANPNLEEVAFVGPGFAATNTLQNGLGPLVATSNFGNLSGNLKMKSYSWTYGNNGNTNKGIIDNIFSTLKAAKIAGAPLTKIDFTSNSAPTGGASNADAQWLATNGVTVILGTL